MTDNANDWLAHKIYVLEKLNSIEDKVDELNVNFKEVIKHNSVSDINVDHNTIDIKGIKEDIIEIKSITHELKNDLNMLKVNAGVAGGIVGLIATAIGFGIQYIWQDK